jgi:hypothetical protein
MHRARNIEIYQKRKAGRTLRSLAAEYGLSSEQIRTIEWKEKWHEDNPDGPSRRARRAIKFVLFHTGIDRMGGFISDCEFTNDLETIARQVAEAGRAAFAGRDAWGSKICPQSTLVEIEAWDEIRLPVGTRD